MCVLVTIDNMCHPRIARAYKEKVGWDSQGSCQDLVCLLQNYSFLVDNPHCVLLGPNNAIKKLVCPKSPPGKWITQSQRQKHDFLPRGVEGQTMKHFFFSAISEMCQLWTNECTGDDSTGPHLVPRDYILPEHLILRRSRRKHAVQCSILAPLTTAESVTPPVIHSAVKKGSISRWEGIRPMVLGVHRSRASLTQFTF